MIYLQLILVILCFLVYGLRDVVAEELSSVIFLRVFIFLGWVLGVIIVGVRVIFTLIINFHFITIESVNFLGY